MAYAVGLVVLIVGLLVSIALHEVGHMVPAKRFGVRVSKYMVGFGPTLWSRTRGETEYGLKAIPLGGYVRLVGMFAPADVVGARQRPGRIGELVAATREASAEEVRPGDEHRAFYRLSTPKKVVVMLGGPVMNLLIAVVLLAVVLVGFGIPGAATTTVASIGECLLPQGAPPDRQCTAQDPAVPAEEAGLQVGDVLVSWGGREISSWADFPDAVQEVRGSDIPLVVERDGELVSLSVTPAVRDRPVYDETGAAVLDPEGLPVIRPTPYVGVGPVLTRERQPLATVLPAVGVGTLETAKIVVALPLRLVDVAEAAFGDGVRDETSVIGVVGVARIAGDLAASDQPFADHVIRQLLLLASLNLALFVFNLIPLLPLDGGHVVGALWEGAKRQVARVRGAPRPAPADVARMMPLAYAVFVAFALMGLLLIYADIVRPVTLR